MKGAGREVCYYVETPLDRRDCERFGLDLFKARGYRVSVVELHRALYPGVVHQPGAAPFEANTPADWREAARCVERKKEAFGIVMLNYDWNSRPLYASLRRSRVRYAQICTNAVPPPDAPAPGWLLRRGPRAGLSGMFRMVLSSLRRAAAAAGPRVQSPRLVLRGSRRASAGALPEGPGTENLWIHTLDYDLYLRHRAASGGGRADAVFLDEFLPFHPDFARNPAANPGLDPASYYAGMERFFNRVEAALGTRVVVAAHPKDDGTRPGFPAGRTVLRGRTAELVREARLVLAHGSTAINFAVLFEKPVLFLTSDALERADIGRFYRGFARRLGKSTVNVDRPEGPDWDGELSVDRGAYRAYKEDFIKVSGSPEKPFWEVVADRLDSLEPAGAASGGRTP